MRWRMELIGDATDLRILGVLFPEGMARVQEENGKVVLVSRSMEALSDARQVRRQAACLLEQLVGAAKLRQNLSGRVTTGVLRERQAQREASHQYVDLTVATAEATVAADGVVVGKGGDQWRQLGDEQLQKYVQRAQTEPDVARVLSLVAGESTWFNLYKVYEIIRKDAGGGDIIGLASKGWATVQELQDFRDTANWHHTPGGRHAIPTNQPANAMSPADGKELIRRLALRWIGSKV